MIYDVFFGSQTYFMQFLSDPSVYKTQMLESSALNACRQCFYTKSSLMDVKKIYYFFLYWTFGCNVCYMYVSWFENVQIFWYGNKNKQINKYIALTAACNILFFFL